MRLVEEYKVVANILIYYSRRPSRRPVVRDKYEYFWRDVDPHPHALVRAWRRVRKVWQRRATLRIRAHDSTYN